MRHRIVSRSACSIAALALAACGSSPTEPTMSAVGPQTTLRIVVTKCDLVGSVIVATESAMLGTLPTPGEATFFLPPGPHSLQFRRGNQEFAGSDISQDALRSLAPGATASIVAMDPLGACMTTQH